MEPITTAWMMSSLLAGWMGNRTDFFLCKGANTLYNRITSRINEPANHHIQRAIRKSYLQASHMAVNFLLKDFKAYQILNEDKSDLKKLQSYIEKEINQIRKDKAYLPESVLDNQYKELLFPKECSSLERQSEIIEALINSIVQEFNRRALVIHPKLNKLLFEGWTDNEKKHDFYGLIAAFFMQELKEQKELTVIIQTEYLDNLTIEQEALKIQITDLQLELNQYYNTFKNILPGIDDLIKGQKAIKDELDQLPEKTARLVLEGIQLNQISATRDITVSLEYQDKIKRIDASKNEINDLETQLKGILNAVEQVDQNTKAILKQNAKSLEVQILKAKIKKTEQEESLNLFVQQILQLSKKLKETQSLQSDRLEKARQLFKEGNYKALNETLNEEAIEQDFVAFQERANVLANEMIIKAEAIVINKNEHWFEKASKLFERAISINENFNTLISYADFLFKQKQINEAINYYNRAESLTQIPEERVLALHQLGNSYRLNNDFHNADIMFSKTIEIRNTFENKSIKSRIKLSDAYSNQGDIMVFTNQFQLAEELMLKSMSLRDQIIKEGEKIDFRLSRSYNQLFILYKKMGKLDLAIEYINKAIDITERSLERESSESIKSELAVLYNNKAVKELYNPGDPMLFELSSKACKIYEELSDINPKKYLGHLGIFKYNLAINYLDLKQYDDALKINGEALAIIENLIEINSKLYGPIYSLCNENQAILLAETGAYQKAIQLFQKADAIITPFTIDHPERHNIQTAELYLNISQFYKKHIPDKSNAANFAKKGLDLLKIYKGELLKANELSKELNDCIAE